MCGIVGYTGREAAAPIVLNGLSKLEYRGYDSAGVAVFNEAENDIDIVKTKGRLKNLLEKTDSGKAMPGGCGIGHTRWATHGAPSEKNAHPHCSDDKMVVFFVNTNGEKVVFVSGAGKEAVKAGVHAGQLVKKAAQICSGNGGGKPDMAQAGGKDVSKVDEAINTITEELKSL